MTKQAQFDALVIDAAQCTRCPTMCGRSAVLSQLNGPIDAAVMFIGEAPGRKGADRTRIPFSGDQSGRNFEQFLASINLSRTDIFITSAALCNPRSSTGANRRPAAGEIRNCSDYLRRTINLIDPKIIVTLGNAALGALKLIEPHEYSLRTDAAKIRPWNARRLIPLYHPSPQVLITSRNQSAQVRDYQTVARAIRQTL